MKHIEKIIDNFLTICWVWIIADSFIRYKELSSLESYIMCLIPMLILSIHLTLSKDKK